MARVVNWIVLFETANGVLVLSIHTVEELMYPGPYLEN